MEQLLVAFAVWGIWSLIAYFFEASPWVWIVIPMALGVGGQCLIDWDEWYLGLGIGALAIFLMRIHDLLLVTADWVKVAVLRHQQVHRRTEL